MKKISVIVPVYNVEYDLREALNSLLNQTIIDDIEVIIVDDGSTDSSRYIVDEYASMYDNFHAYHKENGGLSSARNYGMQYAKGEYIHFFDSDDLVAYDAYEKLYEYAKKDKYDIITGNFLKFTEEKTWANVIEKFVFKDLKEDIPLTNLLKTPNLTWDMFAWNKIFRREFLEENNISFHKENITFEDNLFSIEVYDKAEKIAVTKDFIYFWRVRASGTSITQDYSRKRADDLIKIFNLVKEYIDENISEKEILDKKYLKWLIWDIPLFLELFEKFPDSEHETLIEEANGILDLVPAEFFSNINTYFNTLYDIIRDKDLDDLLRFLAIDYKKNPEIPEDLDEKYKETLNFIEDAEGEELDSYAASVSKKDEEIIIKINNHIPFLKSKESDEAYAKLVNENYDDLILGPECFKENKLHIPVELINPGENILFAHYKSGDIEKEHYVLTNSRKTYSFDDFDINIARGMTSYLRLIKREKNNVDLIIDEINFLEDKIEFKGTSNEAIEKLCINDILDLAKLSFSVEKCDKNSEGNYDIAIAIDYNEFLKAPVKKWELEIDGPYNKVNVNEKHYFADDLYEIEIRNYGNKILMEFNRYDPAEKIVELNKKKEKLSNENKKLKSKNKKLEERNKDLKEKNKNLKKEIKAFKSRKIIKIIDKIKKH